MLGDVSIRCKQVPRFRCRDVVRSTCIDRCRSCSRKGPGVSEVLHECLRSHASVAIVGTCKNAGKTTCLNALLERFGRDGLRIAVTSVGRDGEDIDAVTDRPKPRIHPLKGSLVATSRVSAQRSAARLREVATTPFRTALGPVSIYEVAGPGWVEVAGPVTVSDTVVLMRMLERLGAERILVDGAIDRRASASPKVASALVLATGMALDDDPAEVVRSTSHHVRLLTLPGDASGLEAPGTGTWLDTGNWLPYPEGTPIGQAEAWEAWLPSGTRLLAIEGALTDGLSLALVRAARRMSARERFLVVPDATHLLLGRDTLGKLEEVGFVLHVRQPVHLAGVVVNPTRPWGASQDPAEFLARMQAALHPVPVHDVVSGDVLPVR